jgi:serine/threonine-protein kinase
VLILVARGATTFDHWRTGIWLLGVPALSYPAVMMGAGLLFPDVRAQFLDPHRLGLFGVNLTFIATGWLLLTAAGNFVWNVRREAREPRRIGRYELERRLGRGGMGEVWAARDPREKRRVALKLLRGPARKRVAVARFQREIRALAGLSHPNIVTVFDFGVTDEGTWYYAMELLEGQNLRELVEKHGPLAPERLVALGVQIAGALVEAHAGGVVHRDIKPENIFVAGGPSGQAKLLDFGIAKTVSTSSLDEEALTATGWVPGTPAYMPPEALRGDPADPRSDIYALGCTLQFALTGAPPGDRASGPIGAMAASLAGVIRRCLESEPAARYPTSQALLLALESLRPAAADSIERIGRQG